jgi:ribosome maturation factor RimP
MLAEDSIEIKVLGILSPSVESMGYEIVRIRMQGSGEAKALQIMIERADGKMINVEDCEKVSKQASALLDIEDPIDEAYSLEISSPGLDRPLTRPKDFVNYAGLEIKLESKAKIDGQAKFRGKLVGMEGSDVMLDLNVIDLASPEKSKRVKIGFDNVKNAKLVLTNELMAEYQKKMRE